MKTSNKNTSIITRQRGFFSVGIGLGLTALYGIISAVVVANHEPGENYAQVNEQKMESPIQVSAYTPQHSESDTLIVNTYE